MKCPCLPDESLLEDVQSDVLRAEGVPQDVIHIRDPDPDPGVGTGMATRGGRRAVGVGRRGPHVVLPEGPEEVGAEFAADRVVEERLGDGEGLGRRHATLELDGDVGGGGFRGDGGRDEDLGVDIHGTKIR